MPIWDTAADLDAFQSESKVVHESVANTDHDNGGILKQGYSAADADPFNTASLEGYYPLDEDSGTTAYDQSGNNNDGTLNGPTVNQTGILSTTGYTFGADDWVDLPTISKSGAFTIASWVYPTDASTTRRAGALRANTDTRWEVTTTPALQAQVFDGSGRFVTSGTINLNQWYFMCHTYDGGSNLTLYVDGSQVDQNTNVSSPLNDANAEDLIGGFNTDGTRSDFWRGNQSNVWYWSTDLTATQISTLYEVVRGTISGGTNPNYVSSKKTF